MCNHVITVTIQVRQNICRASVRATARWCGPVWTSGQDGGIGRHTVPPRTTKRRTTTNLKTKKQSELPGNRTLWKFDNQGVEEETFIQTGRRGRDGQLGWRRLMARWRLQDGDWWSGWSHLCVRINWEEWRGSETDLATRVPVWGNKASKPLNEKTCGGWGSRRNSKPHRRVCWRYPQDPRTTETHPHGNQY